MPLSQVPPELKSIAPFLQRAEEMRSKDPIISFWCEYYAVKKGLTLKLSSEARPFLFQLMDSLESTKKLLRDQEAITNDEVAHLYVENFADRIFIMADEEDRKGVTSRSTAKKFLAAGQFFDLLSAFDSSKLTQGPKTSEKRTYAKWRATEISKAFRDGRNPPPPPSPIASSNAQLPTSSTPTDPSASQTLTASSMTSLPPLDPSTSTQPPTGHTHSRTQSTQSPPPVSTSFVITSPNGSGIGTGTSRRRASDVSLSTPTRSAGGSSPSWSSRVQPAFETAGRQSGSVETSPVKEKRIRRGLSNLSSRATPGVNEEESDTDPGTEDEEGGAGARFGRERLNPMENGHEAGGENQPGVWDARQASLAVQAPESRHQSFAQRPGESGLPYTAPVITSPPVVSPVPHILGHPPISPTATSPPGINGPPPIISRTDYGQPDSAPSSQPSSKQTSPKSAQSSVASNKQTSPRSYYANPGRVTPPGAPPPSTGSATATPVSSHASVASVSTPTSSPAPACESPASSNGTAGAAAPTSALVLPPRRVHFSGSTVGGMSSIASSPEASPEFTPTSLPDPNLLQITGPPSTSPTHSRRYEPTPRAPAAILPPPDVDSILPPLSNALVRPQSYQINRAVPSNIAYPTASAPPYPEPTYAPPPPLVHHHGHSSSPSQSHAVVHVQQSSYPYAPATPQVRPTSPPLPSAISGPATQRAQKHAKFAISALDYDDLETARKELMNALAIVNGRSAL